MDIEKELEKQWKHVNVYGSVAIFNNMKLMIQEIVKEYEEQLNFANSELIELRAYKEAAEIQVPFAWANNQGETTINEIQVEYWRRGGYEITPLYAKPSVAVPDDLFYFIKQSIIPIMQACGNSYSNKWCEELLIIAKKYGAYKGGVIGKINDLIGQYDADIDSPSHSQQSAEQIPECFKRLTNHAVGMCFGVDWNRGTAATLHRQKLIDTAWECDKYLSGVKHEG